MKCDMLIFDGKHLLWRASDAFKELSVELGGRTIGTGGIYGFLAVLIRIGHKYGGKCVVAWEGSGNFRKELYPDYKKKAEPDEDMLALVEDMAEQEKRLMAILRHLGIPQYLGKGCEADDVIGRLATEAKAEGKRVIIYTGDSDIRQLVHDFDVTVVSPGFRGKDTVYDRTKVIEKHGVPPDQIAALKALAGDNSDNIPGVPGIGPVTASKLLQEYDTVEDIIEAARHDKPWPVAQRFKDKIIQSAEDIELYLKLTTIGTSLPWKLVKPAKNKKKLLEHFMAYRFKSLLAPAEMYILMGLGDG